MPPAPRKRSTAGSRRRSTRSTTRRSTRAAAMSPPKDRAGFPRRIFALASPYSLGGISMFEPGALAEADTVANFVSDPELVMRAMHMLQDAGFEVLQANELMINIAGTAHALRVRVPDGDRQGRARDGQGARGRGHLDPPRHDGHRRSPG